MSENILLTKCFCLVHACAWNVFELQYIHILIIYIYYFNTHNLKVDKVLIFVGAGFLGGRVSRSYESLQSAPWTIHITENPISEAAVC